MADLFEAYVAYLKASEKPSGKEAEKGLNKIADTLGRNRPAREIEPDEITDLIRPIYDRGKRSMADHVRSYIRSAYSWGIKSEHDYRSASQRRFRLVYNPAAGIPTEPKNVGTRWLDEEEFLRLYRWLECPDAPVHPPYTRAVRILMLTGQRVVVTNRDLRRTWKTLAGQAGLPKEIRDRLQNHTLQDVSSKSYDRWNYMPEKRAAMKKWNAFARAFLSKKRPKSTSASRYDAAEEAA